MAVSSTVRRTTYGGRCLVDAYTCSVGGAVAGVVHCSALYRLVLAFGGYCLGRGKACDARESIGGNKRHGNVGIVPACSISGRVLGVADHRSRQVYLYLCPLDSLRVARVVHAPVLKVVYTFC